MKNIVKTIPLSCLALAISAANVAVAAEEGKTRTLQEVVVTAEKRETKAQETPISMSVADKDVIETRDVTSIADLPQLSPNLTVVPAGAGSTGSTISIRGAATQDPIVTQNPTVGVYVDGVYTGKSAGSVLDFADLERVEVLRGPQGTLYGRNTTGGAINLITAKPTGKFGFTETVDVGNYDYMRSKTALNFDSIGTTGEGLGKLSSKLTFNRAKRDGFYEIDGVGAGAGSYSDLDNTSGMLQLRLEATDKLMVDYAYDNTHIDENPLAVTMTEDGTGFLGGLVNTDPDDGTYANAPSALGIGAITDLDTDELYNRVNVQGHNLTINYAMADNLDFRSITSQRKVENKDANDFDGSAAANGTAVRDIDVDTFSQEFQLIGELNKRLNYVVGLYYDREEGTENNPQVFLTAPAPTTPPFTSPYTMLRSFTGIDNESKALYGQMTYIPAILDDRLSLTAGLRYTQESRHTDRDLRVLVAPSFYVPIVDNIEGDKDYHDLSPMVKAAFQAQENVNVYASIARGYKSGAYNGRAASAATFGPVDAESVISYELGLKSEWLDNTLQFNAAYFYNDFRDLQRNIFSPSGAGTTSFMTNVSKATTQGIDAELAYLPTDALRLSAGVGYIDARYGDWEICDPLGGGGPGCAKVDIGDDAHFSSTPRKTASVAAEYSFPQTAMGAPVARIDAYHQSETWFDANPSDMSKADAYTLWNARLAFNHVPVTTGDLTLALWGKNLTNEEYNTFGIEFTALTGVPSSGYALNNWGDPRTFGLELIYKY